MAEHAGVRLKADARLPSAEIVVLDRNFQFVHRDVGSLDVVLAPGVYTVQFRAGSAASEVPVSLRPGAGEVVLSAPALDLKSPAPLAQSASGALYGPLAVSLSGQVHRRIGRGAELFLFVRYATNDIALASGASDQLFNVTVLDASGHAIASLNDAPQRSGDDHARGYTLELDPGSYVLRYAAGARLLEQACIVCEDWQTQVFASSRRYGDASPALGPNFPNAAVFMMRRGHGFHAENAKSAWSESARQALVQGVAVAPERHLREAVSEASQIRRDASPARMRDLLMEKFPNPMLGIYGAHLLLQSPQRDWALLRELVTNLKLLIGPHPDVTALTLLPELRDLADGERYAVPPMLRTSWSLIVSASLHADQIVPDGSYSDRVADRMWGSDAWLVWQSPEEEPTAEHERHARDGDDSADFSDDLGEAIATVLHYVSQRLQSDGGAALRKDAAEDARLSSTERALLLHIASTADRAARLIDAIRAESTLAGRAIDFLKDKLGDSGLVERARQYLEHELASRTDWTSERLVRALGLPAGAVKRAVTSLASKLRTRSP